MLDEYALMPDIFDPNAYSNPALIEAYLPFLKEPLLQEALVRDLRDGGWSQFCMANSGSLHRLCREIVRKLAQSNRLRRFPRHNGPDPATATDWCQEGLGTTATEALTGIIAGHNTKQGFVQGEIASIEKLTGAPWWQRRSPSITLDRKTAEYQRVLHLVLMQANSLMFIDPNLDPSSYNYREFGQLLATLATRSVKPRLEIHRSLCKGDGPGRTFPKLAEWQASFASLHQALAKNGLSAEVFFWDDFHDRYLVSDVVGISVPGGFDITGKPGDTSIWGRLGRETKDQIQRQFDPATRAASLKWRFTVP